MKKTLGKRIANFAMAMAVAVTVLAGTGVQTLAYTQTTGTVISDNVKVRSDASTTAKQVSSLKNGDVVDIVDEATDSSGYVWYKIYVNKSEFGYVRSDLVNKKGGSSSNTTATETATQSVASLPETQATATEQRNATALADSVNVRKGAGTAYDSVGKVSKGGSVVITGEANGTDGKTWYQITFGDGQTGFVRSDLVAVSDTPVETTENVEGGENTEAENPEGGEGENTESQESSTPDTSTGDGAYSLMYTADEDGNGVWYLYDNFGGYRVKVKELIEAAQSADAVNSLRKSSSTYKKICIVLGILAAILVAGVVVLVLKLRDSLYYEDEEDEEYDRYSAKRPARDEERGGVRNEEVRPERPFRRNADAEAPRRDSDGERPTRRNAEDRTVRPTRRNPEDEYEKRPARRPAEEERPSRRNKDDEEMDVRPGRNALRDAEERQARRQEARRDEERAAAPKRKARNFVGDDDDFEFEFLDLDDDK
ncbi:MAG: SH3 domain-containing protein [Butyrivibrio sp.]|nr:SH3 domain-containing protein [Butyrivibrio sp.]